MVAALLDLQKGAAFPVEAVHRMARGLRDMLRWIAFKEVALRLELRLIAEHTVDFGQCGIALRCDLGGATGDDDRRLGVLAAGAADRLA